MYNIEIGAWYIPIITLWSINVKIASKKANFFEWFQWNKRTIDNNSSIAWNIYNFNVSPYFYACILWHIMLV